ncbi:centrosome-associated protein CEP250-like [Sinocyclocheilus anshuiensis]|uniref:centrosome-associated protein CEP250-like n=1 Tax=Sinocyclocheilus anshuiensis TaxID=1608454 RepID=UPI0007B8F753|nr:PREDICTED: centrosome-associated protein CEP250-like [Sinocyclocheilus anshuiensis]
MCMKQGRVEEREALILELQDVITELHQEMSLKEQHELEQLQQLLQLEARVEELQEQVQGSEDTIAQLRLELAERAESSSTMLNVAEQIQRLEEEVSRLKSQHSSVSQQDWCWLRRAREELKAREEEWKKERSFFQEQLNGVREELHRANLREEEHRLKVLQIDELQREVDKTLALLEKEREDCVKAKELERLGEEQLKDKLVEEQSTVSRLQHELQEAERQRNLLGTRVAALNCDIQQKDCRRLAEQDELAEQMQQVMSREVEVVSLQKEVSRLQEILKQREEVIEKNKHNTAQLQRGTDSLYKQCKVQKDELCDLREEVQEQKESRVKEVQALKEELQSTQSHLQQHRDNLESLCRELETAHRQQRGTEDEVSGRVAALRSQDAELIQLKVGLLEAEKLATDAEARLQPLSESLELCKHKYQACLSKIAQLEISLVAQREEQVLRLRAQVVALQGDLQVHCAQLESGDDALAALSQQLRDTLGELEHSRKHSQECELLISSLRDSAATLRRQAEEREEMVVKTQADFSIYRATHVHSDSDYESQLSRVQELEHALFQLLERCGQSAQELRVCQLELARHRDASTTEVHRLQEQVRKLQADAADEGRRRAQVDSLEQKVASLEGELQAAQRQCDQAREKIRSKAAEAERQAVSARGLEADLQRAKKEKRQREKECASLKTQMLQLREQLKEYHATCRDTAQELTQQQEKVQLLERGQRLAQEQLSERVTEVVQAEKAQRRLQAELKRITDSLESTQQELQDSRCPFKTQELTQQQEKVQLLERGQRLAQEQLSERVTEVVQAEKAQRRLQAELKRITDSLESTQQELQDSRRLLERVKTEASSSRQEAVRLQQVNQQIQEELDVNRETLSALQTKMCEQEKLLNTHQEHVSELQLTIHRLQEEEVNSQTRLQLCRRELETRDEQVEKHYLEATVSRLKLDLEQERERWQQGVREAAKADQRGRELRLELSAAQASHKEYMELLAEYSREVTAQRSEQARLQQCLIQLTEERETQEERVRQMSADLQRAHSESRCSQEEVEALLSQMDAANQKYSTAVCEADVLRQCLGDARSDSSRLHRESELVVTNVNQWVKEQKHTNEKLALKIKDQSRKIIHLTAERDHLQENVKGLQGEIRRLKAAG